MQENRFIRLDVRKRLNIALVTETYPPEVNGVAMTIGRFVDGLIRRGHSVHLVRPRQHVSDKATTGGTFNEMLVRGVPIPRYAGLRFGLPAKTALMRAWTLHRPDIVHVATEGPLGWSAVAAARALQLPVSSSFHTNFDAYSRHYGFSWLQGAVARYLRFLHNRTNATLVPTQSLVHELGALGYRNLEVVSRGVDTELFHPGRRSMQLRTTWGAAPDDLVVGYVGRLAAEKNLDLVLAAFAAIKRSTPGARLVFVGEGPLGKPLSVQHPEHIFAGLRRGVSLAMHYASLDIFLFPSLTETFGNVTTEALASGLGVVAYDCAAAADLIEDGVNGRLVASGKSGEPDESKAFILAAVALATDRDVLAQMRSRAAASVAHLDWEHVHDHFVATLQKMISPQKEKDDAEGIAAFALD